jgi:hypothetical protein
MRRYNQQLNKHNQNANGNGCIFASPMANNIVFSCDYLKPIIFKKP